MTTLSFSVRRLTVLALIVTVGWMSARTVFPHAQADTISYPVYGDALHAGWSNWSWNSNVNLTSAPSRTGSAAIRFAPYGGWAGLYLHSSQAVSVASYSHLTFSLQSSQDVGTLAIQLVNGADQATSDRVLLSKYVPSVQSGWRTYSVPLADLKAGGAQIAGMILQDTTGSWRQETLVDDVAFTGTLAAPSPTPTPTPTATPTPSATPKPSPTPTPVPTASPAPSGLPIYTEGISSGWNNWSWGATVIPDATGTVQAGSHALAFKPSTPWSGFYLRAASPMASASYASLQFWLNGADDRQFGIALYDSQGATYRSAQALTPFKTAESAGWKKYEVQLSSLMPSGSAIGGVLIQDISGGVQPGVLVDEMRLAASATSPTTPVAPTASVGYTVSNGTITKNGTTVTLKGVNWFGFDTEDHVVHGLWAANWKSQITLMKSLGFNAVRLPFCPASLGASNVATVDYGKNPDLAGLNSGQVMDKVVNELSAQGLYVLLDFHRPDCQTITDLWYTSSYSEAQWISDLTSVARRYAALPQVIGIDLKNEPHGSATWGAGNASTDWNKAAERAGKAVLEANPNLLIFVEGVQTSATCSSQESHWWGGNLEPIACAPIDAASIPKQKLVLSPHVYGPDVYMQPYFSSAFPSNMNAIWDTQFGFAAKNGYAVVPGEWGGKYGTGGGTPLDVTFQDSLAAYFTSKRICSSFYWSWNPDSGDTGGILKDDWATVWPTKMALLSSYYASCK